MTVKAMLTLAVAMTTSVVWAAPKRPSEAETLFAQGSDHVEHGRCNQAIPLLERSYALLESPNTALLLARCLRDTGSPEEAYVRYEVAIRLAEERVGRGNLQYAATERAARDERDALRAAMGAVVIRGLVAGDRLEVHRLRVEPRGTATVIVRAGATKIRVLRAGDVVRELAVTVTAGGETILDVPPEKPAEPPPATATVPLPPPPPPSSPERGLPWWVPPAAITSSAVAALGIGSFVFFGLRSEDVWSALESCAPRCQESLRKDAERAEREQTYANVGLIVGASFALIAAPLIVYWLSSPSPQLRAGPRLTPSGLAF